MIKVGSFFQLVLFIALISNPNIHIKTAKNKQTNVAVVSFSGQMYKFLIALTYELPIKDAI